MWVNGFKAFGKDIVCIDKQYKENAEFVEDEIVVGEKGMHFCENPIDVLIHYPLVDIDCEFITIARVEGEDPSYGEDDRICATKHLKIGTKLSFNGYIKACIDYACNKAKKESLDKKSLNYDDLTRETGQQIASKKDYDNILNPWYYTNIASEEKHTRITTSGKCTKIISRGFSIQVSSSGNFDTIASSGNNAHISVSGEMTRIVSGGHYSKISVSGDLSRILSTGCHTNIVATGRNTLVSSTGNNCVITAIGMESAVKAKKGSFITLAEHKWNNKIGFHIVCVKTEQVDGERIKEDTFYCLDNGEFKECQD